MGMAKAAQHLLHRLLESEDEFALWGWVIRQFRLLLQAREILDGRGNQNDVARAWACIHLLPRKPPSKPRAFRSKSLEYVYHKLFGDR